MKRRLAFVVVLTAWTQLQRVDARLDLDWWLYMLLGVPVCIALGFLLEARA